MSPSILVPIKNNKGGVAFTNNGFMVIYVIKILRVSEDSDKFSEQDIYFKEIIEVLK